MAAQPRVGEVLVQPEKDSLHAIATDAFSSRSSGPQKQLGAAAVQLHVPEFVDAQQNDPSVARDGLRQRFLVGGLDQFVGRAWWPACLTRKPDIAASVPSAIRRWDLPVPESPIKHSGWPFLTHSHLARVWTTAGSILGLASKSKPRRDFSRGTCGRDPALGSTAFSVVTFGQFSAERAGHCCILGSCVGSAYMGGQP